MTCEFLSQYVSIAKVRKGRLILAPSLITLLLGTVVVSAFISGIFGMAGGLVLMGVLTVTLPVATAMIFHGAVQLVSNGWRAFLLRRYISWKIVGRYLVGGVAGIVFLVFIFWKPEKQAIFIMLGVLSFVPWIPKQWFSLNAEKPYHAEILGFIAQALNTLAGVVGPVLDIFFVKTELTRHQIVATKATTQVIAHLTKIGFWMLPVLMSVSTDTLPPLWLIAVSIPLSMLGTWMGGKVLEAMTDISFREWTRWVLTLVGTVYLLRGAGII